MSLRRKHRLTLGCAELESRLATDAGAHLNFTPFPNGGADQDPSQVRALPGPFAPETPDLATAADQDGSLPDDAISASLVDQAFALPHAEPWQGACAHVLNQAATHPTLRYHQDLHEDLVQEVYLDWHRWQTRAGKPTDAPPQLTHGSPELADFQRAVERVFGRARTQLKRQPVAWDVALEPAPAGAPEHDWAEVEQTLANALAALPPEQRRVVELYGEGKTFQEIGQELSCSKQRAWRAWDRAYDHVRSCLAGE